VLISFTATCQAGCQEPRTLFGSPTEILLSPNFGEPRVTSRHCCIARGYLHSILDEILCRISRSRDNIYAVAGRQALGLKIRTFIAYRVESHWGRTKTRKAARRIFHSGVTSLQTPIPKVTPEVRSTPSGLGNHTIKNFMRCLRSA
jgi:hypothetical protein